MTNACNPFLQRHSRAKSQKLFLIFWRNSLASICIHCWHRCIVDTDVLLIQMYSFRNKQIFQSISYLCLCNCSTRIQLN